MRISKLFTVSTLMLGILVTGCQLSDSIDPVQDELDVRSSTVDANSVIILPPPPTPTIPGGVDPDKENIWIYRTDTYPSEIHASPYGLAGMRVNATITNTSTGSTRSETWWTNDQGVIRVCGAANETYSAIATTASGSIDTVQPTANSAPITGSFAACNAGTVTASNDVSFATDETRVWFMMDVIRELSLARFNRAPSSLTVVIGDLPQGVRGRYTKSSRTITLDPINLGQPVLSLVDWSVLSHEFGHALQHLQLGGLDATSNCGLLNESSLTCAYQEGFSEFHAAVTVGASPGEAVFGRAIEDTHDTGIHDGAELPVNVSAVLWDLWDSSNEGPHDNTTYPATYISETMRTCRIGSHDVSGIDMLIYCLEDRMTAEPTFEPLRDFSPSSTQSSSATKPAGWSANDIRAVWEENLAPPFVRPGFNGQLPPPPCPINEPSCQPDCDEENPEDCCEEGEGGEGGGENCTNNEFDLSPGPQNGLWDQAFVVHADATWVARRARTEMRPRR